MSIQSKEKSVIEALINKFKIEENPKYLLGEEIKPSYDFDLVKQISDFLLREINHKVEYHYSPLDEYFDHVGITDTSCILIHNISCLSNKYFEKTVHDESNISCKKLNQYVYCTDRSKTDEIRGYQGNVISGVIAILHAFVYKNKYKEELIDAFVTPLNGFSIYNFNQLPCIKAGSNGNNRLYGCKLFAPLLGASRVKLTNLYIWTPTEEFYEDTTIIKKIRDFFKQEGIYIKIILENAGELQIECFCEQNFKNYFCFIHSELLTVKDFCTPLFLKTLKEARKLKLNNRFFYISTHDCKNITVTFRKSSERDISLKEAYFILVINNLWFLCKKLFRSNSLKVIFGSKK